MKLDFLNRRALVKSLNTNQFKLAVEVGTRAGYFSKYILDHTLMKVIAIDPWIDNAELSNAEAVYQQCVDLLKEYNNRVYMLKAFSPAAANIFKDESFDFVYIDALHDYTSVFNDLNAWWPKIKKGRIMAGHDFSETKWPGVVNAVKQFCQVNNVRYNLTGIVGNSRENYEKMGEVEYDGDEMSWCIIKEEE